MNEYKKTNQDSTNTVIKTPKEILEQENKRLRRETKLLKQECEILKKQQYTLRKKFGKVYVDKRTKGELQNLFNV